MTTPLVEEPVDAAPRRRRRTWWIWVLVVLALLIAAGTAVGIVGKRLYDQAMGVRGHLELAMTEVKEVQKAVLAVNLDAAAAASDRLSVQTKAAVAGAQGDLWSFAEGLPLIGENLVAVRLVAEVTDNLATEVVAPASAVSLDSFRPQDGRIDLAAVASLTPLLDQVDAGIDAAAADLAAIDRSALMDQVTSGLTQLDDALATVQPMISPVRDIVSVLPNALGAEGPRTYLLMFQGNSEARSLGGNAAVFSVLRVEDGRMELTDTFTSLDFEQRQSTPVVDLDPEAVNIFGDKIGRFTPDFTMVPHFPEAVRILEGWWPQVSEEMPDAVISVDPVALSYLLGATGPVVLPTGDTLNADNATSLLLNDVYFRYEDPLMQDAFFAAAAEAVFSTLTSGAFAPLPLMTALMRATDEGRILYQTDDEHEAALITGSRMAGVMPADDAEQTVLGVYVNDNTGSKKSYYLDMNVDACRTESTMSGQVTLTSWLTADEADRLPLYISGPYFALSDISTFVVLYGPVGSTLSHVDVDGAPANVLSTGQHLGRPAVKIEILNRLQSAHTISFTFDSVDPATGPVEVWHTPMVRDTPVEIAPVCSP